MVMEMKLCSGCSPLPPGTVDDMATVNFTLSVPTQPYGTTALAYEQANHSDLLIWLNETAIDYGPLEPEIEVYRRQVARARPPMEPWLYATWIVMFASMIAVAVCGNLMVIWIVIAHRRMRTVTNYFLVNLAVADLLMSIVNCLFNFIYMLNKNWPFGEFYCGINNFMAVVTVSTSVFTLTSITCDRYMAIVRPLKPRISKSAAVVVITFVWAVSGIIGSPYLLYSSIHRVRDGSVCIAIWPDGMQITSDLDFIYQVCLMILNYFLPIVVMTCCYIGMGRILWGSRSIGELSQRQIDSIHSKRKVVKMFIFVMAVFGVCWLPYHGYFVYTHYDHALLQTSYVQHLFLAFYWFAMSNAMINPLIYYWMNARFRKYFNTAVCAWRTCIHRKRVPRAPLHANVETPTFAKRTQSYSKSDDMFGERFIMMNDWNKPIRRPGSMDASTQMTYRT